MSYYDEAIDDLANPKEANPNEIQHDSTTRANRMVAICQSLTYSTCVTQSTVTLFLTGSSKQFFGWIGYKEFPQKITQ